MICGFCFYCMLLIGCVLMFERCSGFMGWLVWCICLFTFVFLYYCLLGYSGYLFSLVWIVYVYLLLIMFWLCWFVWCGCLMLFCVMCYCGFIGFVWFRLIWEVCAVYVVCLWVLGSLILLFWWSSCLFCFCCLAMLLVLYWFTVRLVLGWLVEFAFGVCFGFEILMFCF